MHTEEVSKPLLRFVQAVPHERTTAAMRLNAVLLRTFTIGAFAAAMASPLTGTAGAQAGGDISWSEKLHLKSLADIPNRLREPVLDPPEKKLNLTNGKLSREIGNCEEYLNAVTTGFYPANNYELKWSAEFGQCFALRDLQHARPATSGRSYHWSKDSLAHLPPVLVPGSREVTDAAEQAEKRGENWRQFDSSLRITHIDRDLLIVENENYAYSLQILARADFNGGGVEDIAVYGCARGKHSTWSPCEYFIFSAGSNGKLERLTDDRAPYRMKTEIPD